MIKPRWILNLKISHSIVSPYLDTITVQASTEEELRATLAKRYPLGYQLQSIIKRGDKKKEVLNENKTRTRTEA